MISKSESKSETDDEIVVLKIHENRNFSEISLRSRLGFWVGVVAHTITR